MLLSVILCTHNPRPDYFRQTLRHLRQQSLNREQWELIIVDNASFPAVEPPFLPPNARLIREAHPGLTRARATGIREARGELLVFCDDDNLLKENYLAAACELFALHADLGAAGGISSGCFEIPPPPWFPPFAGLIALRNLGANRQMAAWKVTQARTYPACAPLGAGMVLRKKFALNYLDSLNKDAASDRTGENLSGGGDCEMVLVALSRGSTVGYFPELSLTHLIPRERLGVLYLGRLHFATMRSWIRLLDRYGLCFWPSIPRWSVLPRQFRSFFLQQPWSGAAAFIRWAGVCGHLAGQADLSPPNGSHSPSEGSVPQMAAGR